MENPFSVLLYLACPVGMGLMMWLMMRGSGSQAVGQRQAPTERATVEMAPAEASAHGRPVGEAAISALAVASATTDLDAPPWQARVAGTGKPAATSAQRVAPVVRRTGPSWLGGLCLNWKVVGGLAVVGLAIWIAAPNLVWAALPLLLLAACPLSMLLMMRGMGGQQCASPRAAGNLPAEQVAERGTLDDLKVQLAAAQAQQEALVRQVAELEAAGATAERQTGAPVRSDRAEEPVARVAPSPGLGKTSD